MAFPMGFQLSISDSRIPLFTHSLKDVLSPEKSSTKSSIHPIRVVDRDGLMPSHQGFTEDERKTQK